MPLPRHVLRSRSLKRSRERHATLKAAGLCPKCKGTPRPGQTYCATCRDYIAAKTAGTVKERQARCWQKRRREGRCTECGRGRPAIVKAGPKAGQVGLTCLGCRARKRLTNAAWDRRNGRVKGPAQRCSGCGTPGHRRTTCPRRNIDEPLPLAPLRIDDFATARREAA